MKTKISISKLIKNNPAVLIFILLALAAPFIFTSGYSRRVLVEIYIFSALGCAWNILGGFAKQTNWAASSFFSIGAFTGLILYLNFEISPWIGLFAGMVISGIIAFVIGAPILRIRGVYFSIACISVCEIVLQLWKNWEVSGKANGLSIPSCVGVMNFWNMQFTSNLWFYYITFGWMLIVVAVSSWINRSRLGYYLKAVRDDEDAAISMGLSTHRYKIIAFIVSAALLAGTGTFYAFKLTSVDPMLVASFDVSVKIVLCAIIGGIGTIWGPVLGAFTIVFLFEFASSMLGTFGGGVGYMAYGLLMVLVVIFRPAGLISLASPIEEKILSLVKSKKELEKQ